MLHPNVGEQLEIFMFNAMYSMRFYKKFDYILTQLKIQKISEKDENASILYRKKFRNLAWILYLLIKHQIQESKHINLDLFNKEQDDTLLLISHIVNCFTYLPNQFYSKWVEEAVQRKAGNDKQLRSVEERVGVSHFICNEIGQLVLGQVEIAEYFQECEQYMYQSNLTLGNVKVLLKQRYES